MTEAEENQSHSEEATAQSEPLRDKPLQNLAELHTKLKAENDRTEKLLQEQKELAAKRLIGGASSYEEPPKEKEESPKEYATRIMGGKL